MTKENHYIASHWGLYSLEHGSMRLSPYIKDKFPSSFGETYLEEQMSPCRILRPAVRKSYLEFGPNAAKGKRGQEAFVEVSYEQAYDLVAKEINRIKQHYGNEAIYTGCYGWSSAGRFHHAQSQLKRFFNLTGGSVRSVNTYSYAAGEVILPHVIGSTSGMISKHTSFNNIANKAELVVAFGGVALRNAQVNSGGIARHNIYDSMQAMKHNNVEIISISPVKQDSADEFQSQWIAIRPNSDTALILALAHHAIVCGRADENFLEQYTVGYDVFKNYLLGKTDGIVKDIAWAADITGINVADLNVLANKICTKKTFFMYAWALQRADNGEQCYFAAIALAAILGTIGLDGQGFGFGYAATAGTGQAKLPFDVPSVPQGVNPVKLFIPVARISDMLLNPKKEFQYNGQDLSYPDIKMIYWAGGNPFHHHQDLNRLAEAWQKPHTIIAHEHFWNSHARFADIVFPIATYLERNDIAASNRDRFIVYSKKAKDAPFNIPTDFEIFKQLSTRLGFEQSFTEGKNEAEWIKKLYEGAIVNAQKNGYQLASYEEFLEKGLIEFEQESSNVLLSSFRQDPQRYALKTPSGKIEIYSKTIEGFAYDDCPAHPTWIEPKEWLGDELAKTYPLHLLSCQPRDKLHSQWDHAKPCRETKIHNRQPVIIHTADATSRNIKNGDLVRVYNQRGSCLAIANVTDNICNSVVQMATGAWFDPWQEANETSIDLNGNPNVLTKDYKTSTLSQAPSVNSCLVEIEKYTGKAPQPRIYQAPTFDTVRKTV